MLPSVDLFWLCGFDIPESVVRAVIDDGRADFINPDSGYWVRGVGIYPTEYERSTKRQVVRYLAEIAEMSVPGGNYDGVRDMDNDTDDLMRTPTLTKTRHDRQGLARVSIIK